jgi:catechol 2,3-dioxygenase-like lactoylglutathione lyase family enzyme
VRINAIHHVRFAVRDLDRQEGFASDFGLITVERSEDRLVMRTCGGDPFAYVAERSDRDRFIGLAFEIDEAAFLDVAVSRLGAKDRGTLDLTVIMDEWLDNGPARYFA